MTLTLGLGPVVQLQRRLSLAAVFTTLTVYLEAVATLVLWTEASLSPTAVVAVLPVLAAQVVCIRRPARLLVRDRLLRSYACHFALGAVVVAVLALGTPAGGERIVAVGLGALVIVVPSWPAVMAMREAERQRVGLRSMVDPDTLLACLSFEPRRAMASSLRSFGGERRRWATPWLIAGAVLAASLAGIGLLLRMLGVDAGGAVAQGSALLAVLVFYRAVRHMKLPASERRERDTRRPVLILREFRDDHVTFGRGRWTTPASSMGGGASFERLLARELERMGPTTSVGKPGERLPPLGAARDYLTDGDWRQAVTTLIEEAGVVVFVLGHSENLLWEFRTTLAVRGKQRLLIVVPPLEDGVELRRRWERFVDATVDVMGRGIPRALPRAPVVGIFFAGPDVVVMTGRKRARADYRVALRLFEALARERVSSGRDVCAFLRATLPIATVEGDPEAVTDATMPEDIARSDDSRP